MGNEKDFQLWCCGVVMRNPQQGQHRRFSKSSHTQRCGPYKGSTDKFALSNARIQLFHRAECNIRLVYRQWYTISSKRRRFSNQSHFNYLSEAPNDNGLRVQHCCWLRALGLDKWISSRAKRSTMLRARTYPRLK